MFKTKDMNWKDQLRKGNIIRTEYGIREIVWIAFGEFYIKGSGDRQLHCNVVEPVELSEDIIPTLGFVKYYDSSYQRKYEHDKFPKFSYRVNIGESIFKQGFEFIGNDIPDVKYAHHLQNIVWELSGEPLEYKPIS